MLSLLLLGFGAWLTEWFRTVPAGSYAALVQRWVAGEEDLVALGGGALASAGGAEALPGGAHPRTPHFGAPFGSATNAAE